MSRKNITIANYFSIRLKTLLEDHLSITQKAFSNKVGISQGYLSMVLKGKRGASAELIAGLYIHYGKYLEWLLTGEGEMIPGDKKDSLYNKVEDEDPEIVELLEGARKVLKSGNKVAFEALERNIRYFSQAVDDQEGLRDTKNRLDGTEKELAELKSDVSKIKNALKNDRRSGQRRQEDKGQLEEMEDRRSGEERRAM